MEKTLFDVLCPLTIARGITMYKGEAKRGSNCPNKQNMFH